MKLDNKNSSSVREFEQWVHDELHGANEQPSHEQPATDQWSYNYDGDRYHIRAVGNDDCVAHADKLKDAAQIVEDHNRRLRGERQQPVITGTGDGDTDEWRVDDYEINDGKRSIVRAPHPDEFPGLTQPQRDRVAKASRKNLATIVSDHNQHQQCAAQLRYLGNRAEELSSLLAGMTTERDWFKAQCENLQEEVRTAAVDARVAHEQNKRLRETLRQAREQIEFLEQALEEHHGSRERNSVLDVIDAALNHAEQGEGS